MIQRHLSQKISEAAMVYPVITVTGPRQSGKTTLVKSMFPDYRYVSLEDPDERRYATEDPRGFLSQFSGGAILDEVQRVPDLLSYIQSNVDNNDVPGRFILTGSQNFLLMNGISQSLAGRTAIFNLMPFTKRELESRGALSPEILETLLVDDTPSAALFLMMWTGFYPRIHDRKINPYEWLTDYIQTYVQRDVRMLLNVGDTDLFIRFVKLCAGRAGQLFNASSVAADCGISPSTVHRWLSILESSFIVFRLLPYHENFSKRIIKSPKLYFIDTGLLCQLLRITDPDDLRLSPYRGAVFENFVIAEFLKAAYHRKQEPGLYFWRDSSGHEIDLVIETDKKLHAVEIKSGETFNSSFIDGISYWSKLATDSACINAVIYGGSKGRSYKGTNVFPWNIL